MSDATSRPEPLFPGFPPQDRSAWEAAARDSLKGRSLESLQSRTEDGLLVEPIYFRQDLEGLDHVSLTDPPRETRSLAGAWRIRQEVLARTIPAARIQILELAARHQEALPLRLATGRMPELWRPGLDLRDAADLTRLLEGLEIGGMELELDAGIAFAESFNWLEEWHSSRAPSDLAPVVLADFLEEALLTGVEPPRTELAAQLAGLWTREPSDLDSTAQSCIRTRLRISAVIAHEAGATPAWELGFWLSAWAANLRDLERAGVDIATATARTVHELAVGRGLFDEIAKLRAARLLAARFLEAAGLPEDARSITLRGRGALRTQTRHDPWTNLLRASLKGFAAAVGGVDALHLPSMAEGLGEPDELSRRMAANAQVVLQGEAHLDQVADPARGCWYVEDLTARTAAAAWSRFQQLEAAGGFWEALRLNLPQQSFHSAAASRRKQLGSRRDVLIGTNIFPNLAENLPDWAKSGDSGRPAGSAGADFPALVPQRLAEPLEELRKQGERLGVAGKDRPAVWLTCFGPPKQHKARADFSRGFLECGGLKVGQNAGAMDGDQALAAFAESGAPVTVLCSTDDTYAELAPVFIRGCRESEAARGGKPALILLAGHPPDSLDLLREAGVQGFLHLKADLFAVLEQILTHLEDAA